MAIYNISLWCKIFLFRKNDIVSNWDFLTLYFGIFQITWTRELRLLFTENTQMSASINGSVNYKYYL